MHIGTIPYADSVMFEALRVRNSDRLDKWWVVDTAESMFRGIREFGFWIAGMPAGVLTLWNIEPDQKTAYLSYWIDQYWESTGYTTRMVQVLFQHLSDVRDLDTVYAIIQPSNLSSIRVAEKSGMVVSGSDTYRMMDGTMAEHLIYKKEL